MCRMTDTGARWKKTTELPDFGVSVLYWAVAYNGETRYLRAPSDFHRSELQRWLKPLYAVRVTARTI